MNKIISFLVLLFLGLSTNLYAQIASFSFSNTPEAPVTGWTNVPGNPYSSVLTATANGITVSSVSTTHWMPNDASSCSFDYLGASPATYFPDLVMGNAWLQYNGTSYNQALYSPGNDQLELSGLNKDSTYILRMSSSDKYFTGSTEYVVEGQVVSVPQYLDTYNNLSTGVTFQHVRPNTSGIIKIYVAGVSNSTFAIISGIQVFSGSANVGAPVVAISAPKNGTVISEGANLLINSTASETGGSITKVEFFADTTKIGEVDAAPYNYTWVNPTPGNYLITAKATDNVGTISTVAINIGVESLNYFWSTTGNIATGGDSSFVGTVDTNRLAFRTNNIERMSISKDGNLTIGGKDTASHPSFRIYKNGDLAVGTTMDRSVNTADQVGMRYYSKIGMLQVGASDRLDTTVNPIVYGTWPSSGIVINSDEPNVIKGRMLNTVFAGDANTMDSLIRFENVIIASENSHFVTGIDNMFNVILAGYGMNITAPLSDALISGNGNQITKPVSISNINGFANTTADTTNGSLINGAFNQFGGSSQLVSGQYLVNRTPLGTTLGNSNVDFATLPYTGNRQINVPNIDQYPLLALGNGGNASGTVRSNALTILYNGRTQINTTGFANQLTQANVTPGAALDVVSTNTGVLLPRLTSAQRNAIVAGDLKNGLLLYNTDSSVFQYYNGSVWSSVGSGSGGSSGRWLFSTGTSGTVYDTDDNVAIGTNDAAGYKLAVKGSGLFTRIQVLSAANWPDYVFKKEYRLRKLEDLASYIDKYHHLPEIVSAATVGKEGIDLGANQAAILKKVEELTLYLIQENRSLKEQNAQLQRQQAEIDELRALINKIKQ